jgi:DNA-binding transcriptional MerR regulator
MVDSMEFSQADVNRIFSGRVPYTTLRSWENQGFFQSSEGEGDARGRQRIYSRVNLYQIALCEVLVRKLKASHKNIADLMRLLFFTNGQDETTIIDNFNKLLAVKYSDNLDAVLMTKNELKQDEILNPIYYSIATFIINLELIKNDVDNSIKTKLAK